MDDPVEGTDVAEATCSADGCDRLTKSTTGLCKPHYQRQWYEKNREHALAYAKERYDADAARERHQRLKDDPEYLATKKAAYDRWRAENPDRAKAATDAWRAANYERMARTRYEWWLANKDRTALTRRGYMRARRMREKGLSTGRPVDYDAILAEHGMVCHLCGGEIQDRSDLHFDHVIPIVKGGPHDPDNVRPSHARCNLSKGGRLTA